MDERAQELLERIQRWALPEGPIECKGTWLRQVGEMRLGPDRPWFPFEGEQWFEGDGIEFRWKARARLAPLLRASVTDAFQGERGLLFARVLGILPMARSRGPATDKGEAMRGIAELPWRPMGFRESRRLIWRVHAPGRLHATYDDGRTRATVEFQVDQEGKVLGCIASDRPRPLGRMAMDTTWTTKASDYREFDHFRIPIRAEAAWVLPLGSFTYWRAEITDFKALR